MFEIDLKKTDFRYLNKRRIAQENLTLGIGHRSNHCTDKPSIKKKKNGIQNNF